MAGEGWGKIPVQQMDDHASDHMEKAVPLPGEGEGGSGGA